MDPLTLIGIGSSIYGGLKTIFSEDPNEAMRKRQLQLLQQVQAMPGYLTGQASVQTAGALRSLSGRQAAAGVPRNVSLQNQMGLAGESLRSLYGAIGSQRLQTLGLASDINQSIPPDMSGAGAGSLLSTGLQLLTRPGAFGSGGEATGFQGMGAFQLPQYPTTGSGVGFNLNSNRFPGDIGAFSPTSGAMTSAPAPMKPMFGSLNRGTFTRPSNQYSIGFNANRFGTMPNPYQLRGL